MKGAACLLAAALACQSQAAEKPWFMNVVPLWGGSNVSFAVSEMIRQKESAGLDLFVPSLSFHPQTSPARELIPKLCGQFREAKRGVAGKGIRLGVLVQSILGHGWNGKVPLTDETWQHVVHADGRVNPRFCSMDPGFRAYAREAIRAIASEGPEFLLIDDDVGIRNGECFCPLHMAAINRRLGKSYTREQLAGIYRTRPLDDPEIVAANRVLGETICDFARNVIRAALDEVNPEMRCGLCACWPGYWQLDGLVRALAGKTKPFMRVNDACYGDQAASSIVHAVRAASWVMHQVGPDVEMIDEADTFPQNYMSESATMFHAHLTHALLGGLVGAKLWIAEFQEPAFADSQRRYEARLRNYAGFYAEVKRLAQAGIAWKGAGCPVVRPPAGFGGHAFRTPEGMYPDDWSTPLEAVYALPLRFEGLEKGGIVVLREEDMKRLSDDQLRQVLSGRALVDSLAARAITKRGLAPLLGVEATAGGADFNFQSEWNAAKTHSIGYMWDETASELKALDPAAVASWNFCKGARFENPAPCAPSAVRYANGLGGRVVTLGWPLTIVNHKAFRPVRKLELLGELDWLNGGPLEMVGLSGDQALVRHGVAKTGEEIVVYTSLSYEVLPELELRLTRTPGAVLRLSPEGAWKQVGLVRRDAARVAVAVRVDPLEPIVLKIVAD